MIYPDPATLAQSFRTTHGLIRHHTAGLTHADSVTQPPFEGNCLNWVLGHIINGRNEALGYLDAQSVWKETEAARYRTGAPPINGPQDGLPLSRLLDDLDATQKLLEERLDAIPAEAFSAVVETRFGQRPVGQHIAGLHWHETYHTGQLELLRQLKA
ncbi:MAG: DinB family protein [Candidatus Promineifilaceae bacterium]|nr:DinB family protein [Candidatus Promineifilaceae bacterium]